ncbi:MAG: hypothetical protein U0Q10_00040 [Dermatophilaceae bacterium]
MRTTRSRPAGQGAPKSFEQALSEHGGDLADVLLEMLDPSADSPLIRGYCTALQTVRRTLIPAVFGLSSPRPMPHRR